MRRRLLVISFGIIFILIVSSIINYGFFLAITGENHNVLYSQKINLGDTFVYSSIHSTSNTPIEETICITENLEFMATKVKFNDQSGSGLPEYSNKQEDFYIEDGSFVIDNINRIYKSLSFQVNKQYKNTININNHTLLLYQFFESEKGSVFLDIKKKSLLRNLIDKCINVITY